MILQRGEVSEQQVWDRSTVDTNEADVVDYTPSTIIFCRRKDATIRKVEPHTMHATIHSQSEQSFTERNRPILLLPLLYCRNLMRSTPLGD